MWDAPTFFIGLMAGMIIMLCFVWLLYGTRTFVFSVCPRRRPVCSRADYYTDPGDAIAEGSKVEDILFLNNNNELLYKRVPRTSGCIPLSGKQAVTIKYPQHCMFTDRNGISYDATNNRFGSKLYTVNTSTGVSYSVLSSGNCQVERSDDDFIIAGKTLIEWDDTTYA